MEGKQGRKGDTGPPGPRGNVGDQRPRGDAGDRGPRGIVGVYVYIHIIRHLSATVVHTSSKDYYKIMSPRFFTFLKPL